MIYDALRTIVLADTQIAAIVGTRMWFLTADPKGSGSYPDIVQYSAGATPDMDLWGASPPWMQRISMECRALQYDGPKGAHVLGQHVIRVLGNYRGVVAGENIQGCFVAGDMVLADDTTAVRRRVIDFRVHHSPA